MPKNTRFTGQLSVKVKDNGRLTTDLNKRLKRLVKDVDRAAVMAARAATTATRANFKYRRDPIAPRPKRESTGGHMKQHLQWVAKNGNVEFNIKKADREVPHWIIQEIGTGPNARAVMRRHDQTNPQGRPKKGATYVRSVRSQVGRRLSGGLVFATGGQYTPPGRRRDEQLHAASTVTGAPQWGGKGHDDQAAAIRIGKEIRAQNFVRKGAVYGFREYENSVLAAARQAFGKRS